MSPQTPPRPCLNGISSWLEERGWSRDGGDAERQVLRFKGKVASSQPLAVLAVGAGGHRLRLLRPGPASAGTATALVASDADRPRTLWRDGSTHGEQHAQKRLNCNSFLRPRETAAPFVCGLIGTN